MINSKSFYPYELLTLRVNRVDISHIEIPSDIKEHFGHARGLATVQEVLYDTQRGVSSFGTSQLHLDSMMVHGDFTMKNASGNYILDMEKTTFKLEDIGLSRHEIRYSSHGALIFGAAAHNMVMEDLRRILVCDYNPSMIVLNCSAAQKISR